MIFGGCLCALGALRRKISKQIKQFHGAKLSAVPNCPGVKLSWCQIVRGAKLSGAKLSVNMGGAKLS